MDEIIVNPGDVRGLGNVVDPKSLSDYSIESSKVVSGGSETIDNLSRNTISLQYLGGSYMYLPDPITFVEYTSGLASFSVSVCLKYHTGSNITSSPVQCIVNDGTSITENTNSSGIATFTIPFNTGVSIYDLKFVYAGNNNVAGCVLYHRVFVGSLTGIDLTSIPVDFCQTDDHAHLIATLTGDDVSGETIGVPNQIVNFWEQYTPGLMVKASRSVVQDGEDTLITAQMVDLEDGSLVCLPGQTVYIYEEYTPGIQVEVDKSVIQSGETATIKAQLIDIEDGSHVSLSGQTVHIHEKYTPGVRITGPTITYDDASDITLVAEWYDKNDGSLVCLSGIIISIYEDYHPNLTLSSNKQAINSSETATITATLHDDDGSAISGETVEIYEEYELGVEISANKQVIVEDETVTLTGQLIDTTDGSRVGLSGETVTIYQEVDEIFYYCTLTQTTIGATQKLIVAHVTNQFGDNIENALVEFNSSYTGEVTDVRTNSGGSAAKNVGNPVDNYYYVTLPEIYGNNVVADIVLT